MRILVRGANDVGSAVAHLLFSRGYAVVLHETPNPTTARRRMSFTDAVFDGRAILDGVVAELVPDSALLNKLEERQILPVSVADFSALLQLLQPQVLIDARMRKHSQPESQRGLAPLTLGLGPNFVAGATVDIGIETGWDALGQIVRNGATRPLQGEPRAIEGHARERYVYAPRAGVFQTPHHIGDAVNPGAEVARIDDTPLLAPIGGILRGLTRPGVPVALKAKVVEIDPRVNGAQIAGIGERPARIAQGVLTALADWAAG